MAGKNVSKVLYFNGVGLSRGLGCSDCNHVDGLGFLPPQFIVAMKDAAVKIITSAITAISGFLNIGQGRMEADLIVPTQNQIVSTVLAPISDQLDNNKPSLTCSELNQMLDTLKTTEEKWLTFLHDPRWQSPAPQQAEATLAPYFSEFENEIAAEINARCGILGSIGGGGSGTTLALLGAAVFLLPKFLKKG